MSFPYPFHEIQWHDRKPTFEIEEYVSAALAPHAAAERHLYTVPKDKLALIEVASAHLVRVTAAAPVGQARCYITLAEVVGGTEYNIVLAKLWSNTAGDKDRDRISTHVVLKEGNTLRMRTIDLSTGGTIAYTLIWKITEFDAYLYQATPITVPFPLEPDIQTPTRPDPVM